MISGCSLVHFLDPIPGFSDPGGGHVSAPRVGPGLAVQLVVLATRITHRSPRLQKLGTLHKKREKGKTNLVPPPQRG